MRQLKLILLFYKEFVLADFLVTLSCMGLMWYYGKDSDKIIGILLWFKLIAILSIFYLVSQSQKKQLYYYQNLGVTTLRIGIVTSTLDFSFFILTLIIMHQ